MRNKIDYGIDLGTTNSAIARMENGIPTIKKSDHLKDTFPSCIHFNKKKDVIVGDGAYNIMKNDNARALKTFETGKTNTFIEFKRTMGTTHSYESSNMGRTYTSEELSAEILKTLKSVIKDENINSIVITVPAKFLTPQNEATKEAAKLLGFKHIELLQEPVAAATAYGLGSKIKDGFWLVFDFGGGTFDAALVKAEEGILAVKDTDGDNWLGGKNLDEAIVDQIIIPFLREKYSIESVLDDSSKKEILRSAVKFYAEEAKIQLSFKDSHNILTNLGDLPFEDDNGEEPEIDVLVTQKDMENVVAPIFQKAIDICKTLLKRNNLKSADLGALILVGGPTYSPILRRMLKEQITDKIDTSVDPMTVVAKGAALFASTISVSEDVKEASRDKTKLQLDVKYEATTVELDEMVSVKVLKEKTVGSIPNEIFVEIVRFDGAWSSGKKLIGEKATIIDLHLIEGRSNSFEISVFDANGNKLECQPNQLSILQGIGGLDKMQVLPYNIGIGKYFSEYEEDRFACVKGLEKNKSIPTTGVRNALKTRNAIRPGMIQDTIRIPIYQGEHNSEGTPPALNNLVTEVIITGESMPGLLPEGSDVDITIKVDGSSLMKFSAYFPILNYTEELEIEIKQTDPPSEEYLRNEIAQAKRTAKRVNAHDIYEKLEHLDNQLINESANADGKLKILESLRKELMSLHIAEKNAEWPIVEKGLKEAYFDLENLIDKIKRNDDDGEIQLDKLESHLREYQKRVENIIQFKDIKAAKELTEDMEGLDRELRNSLSGGLIDKGRLEYHDREFNNLNWKDKNKARLLVNQGLKLIQEGKTSQLRPLLHQIWDLRIDNTPEGGGGGLFRVIKTDAKEMIPKNYSIADKYSVLLYIKQGSNAETYRVKGKDGKLYFLKLFNFAKLHRSAFNADNSLLEIEFLKSLKHPNIVSYHDSGELIYEGKKFGYLVLNFIAGETLTEKMSRSRIDSIYDLKVIGNGILNGLDYLHSLPEPIIHNEITPQNIMLDLSGDTPQARLIDFGFARSFHQSTKAYQKEGLNLHYVASECFNNLYSPQSDLYSVAAVMYHMLFGVPPWFKDISKFKADRIKSEELILEARKKPLPFPTVSDDIVDFDESILKVFKKGLQQDPENRFQSAKEFLQALNGEVEIEDVETLRKVQSNDKNDSKIKARKAQGKGFSAIAGLEELKKEMQRSVIDILQNPEKAEMYDAKLPNGMVLYGPPGCGKTFFAKHFAEEVGFNFMLATPSTLKSRYINATQENIAKMFEEAEKNAPTIIFIDEINELLPNRDSDSHEMAKSAVNEMLAQMDRIGEKGIFVIGATNFPDMIDPAMLRSGRLEKKFYLPPPDFPLRKALFEMSLGRRKKVLDFGIDYDRLSNLTENYVSSDIESIVNEATSLAMSNDSRITMALLESVIKSFQPFPSQELKKYQIIKAKMDGQNIEEENTNRPSIGFKRN